MHSFPLLNLEKHTQTLLNRLVFFIIFLFSSYSWGVGNIIVNNFAENTSTPLDNVENTIEDYDDYLSDERFYQLLSAENCDILYDEINFKKFDFKNLSVFYDNQIKSIVLDPKNFVYIIEYFEQSFRFQPEEMNEILFQFQSFDLDVLKEMKKIKNNIDILDDKSKSKSAVICSYDYEENISSNYFPDLSININNATQLNELISSKINVYFNGTIEYLFKNYEYQFDKSNYNLTNFPFDSHKIKTVLNFQLSDTSKIYPTDRFSSKLSYLNANNFKDINVPEFSIDQVDYNFNAINNSQSIEMEIEFSRINYSFIFKFLIPVLVLTAISFFLYYLPSNDSVPSALSLVLSMTVFSLVVNDSMPVLPYITFYDAIYFLSFFSIGILICVEVLFSFLKIRESFQVRFGTFHLLVYLISLGTCVFIYI